MGETRTLNSMVNNMKFPQNCMLSECNPVKYCMFRKLLTSGQCSACQKACISTKIHLSSTRAASESTLQGTTQAEQLANRQPRWSTLRGEGRGWKHRWRWPHSHSKDQRCGQPCETEICISWQNHRNIHCLRTKLINQNSFTAPVCICALVEILAEATTDKVQKPGRTSLLQALPWSQRLA